MTTGSFFAACTARIDDALGRLFPGARHLDRPDPAWLRVIGLTGLLLYVLFSTAILDVSRAGETLLFLAAVAVLARNGRAALREPLLILLLIWMTYQIGVGIWAALNFDGIGANQLKISRHYAKVFFLVFVAVWVGGSVKTATRVYLLALIGFLLAIALQSTAVEWRALLEGRRVDFGFMNAQHTAVYFGIMFLGLLALAARFVGTYGSKWFYPRMLLWLALLALSILGLIGTQTRAIWVALVAALLVLVGMSIAHCLRCSAHRALSRNVVSFGIVAVAVAAAVIGMLSPPVESLSGRFLEDKPLVTHLLEEGSVTLPRTSTGIRLAQWSFAAELVKERPLFGWGPVTKLELIAQSDLPRHLRSFGHFHNSYLELAVAYGLVGILCFAAVALTVALRAYRAYRGGTLPPDIFLFSTAIFVFYAVANIFESYVIFRTGFYFAAIFGGVLYSLAVADSYARGAVASDDSPAGNTLAASGLTNNKV